MQNSYYKINQSSRNKSGRKKLLLLGLLLLTILLATASYFWVDSRSGNSPQDTNAIPDASKTPGAPGDTGRSESKNPDSAESTQPPASITTNASLAITENSSSDSGVRIAAIANGIVPTRCIFAFSSPDSRPVVKEIDATGQSCGPLNIGAVEFDKIGEWYINITAYNSQERVVTDGKTTVR